MRLCIRQGLLGFPPARKPLQFRALEQGVDVANAKGIAAVEIVEFVPADGRCNRSAFAAAIVLPHRATARKYLRSFQSNIAALCNSVAPYRNLVAPVEAAKPRKTLGRY